MPTTCSLVHWRKVLSNFYPVEPAGIRLNGRSYSTIGFQAAKYLLIGAFSQALAEELDCSGKIVLGLDPKACKKAAGKAGFKQAGLTPDLTQWDAAADAVTEDALQARWEVD